jgi:hypothetical protein
MSLTHVPFVVSAGVSCWFEAKRRTKSLSSEIPAGRNGCWSSHDSLCYLHLLQQVVSTSTICERPIGRETSIQEGQNCWHPSNGYCLDLLTEKPQQQTSSIFCHLTAHDPVMTTDVESKENHYLHQDRGEAWSNKYMIFWENMPWHSSFFFSCWWRLWSMSMGSTFSGTGKIDDDHLVFG